MLCQEPFVDLRRSWDPKERRGETSKERIDIGKHGKKLSRVCALVPDNDTLECTVVSDKPVLNRVAITASGDWRVVRSMFAISTTSPDLEYV